MMRDISRQSESDFIIMQARMSSHRFPGKMLSLIGGLPLVEYLYERSKQHRLKNVFIATSTDFSDNTLYDFCVLKNIPVFRGDLDNVMARYINAAGWSGAKNIVRICADTPFVDFSLAAALFGYLKTENADYVSFTKETCLPCFYSEAFTLEALRKAALLTRENEDLEHVTKFFIRNPELFSIRWIDPDLNPEFAGNFRLTIDYPDDMDRANAVIKELKDKFSFTSNEVLGAIRKIVKEKGRVDKAYGSIS